MRILKMMENMEVQHGGIGSQKLRDLISFHLNMGKNEEETMLLVADKAEEVRTMQGNSRQQKIDQAMTYMWQRYRDRWPTVVAHKANSQSGMTNFYYSAPDGIKSPPLWGFFVVDGKFLLSHLYMGGLGKSPSAMRKC